MNDQMPCAVCEQPLGCRWTDTHGVGACVRCGAPYRIYHYENDQRVERAPELLLLDRYVPFARRYWNEKRRNVAPGAFNFPGSSYEVATREDFEELHDWMEPHRAEVVGAESEVEV